jgi:hypothetical protein
MPSFSERHGHKSIRDTLQKSGMDNALRNGIWNWIYNSQISSLKDEYINWLGGELSKEQILVARLWVNLFKAPMDELPESGTQIIKLIKDICINGKFYAVYDLVEAIFEQADWDSNARTSATNYINHVLKSEGAAYRVVDGVVSEIIGEHEVAEVEAATNLKSNLSAASEHIHQAVKMLSDRKAPDYRNSIKESISAVEAVCKILTGKRSATLSDALKELEKNGLEIHGAFKEGIIRLYGYTSDEQGIRHSLLDEQNVGFADAKFMLVACSAFVNLIVEKTKKI